MTLDACIQVAKRMYGMIVGMITGGKTDDDGETRRRFNPNNVINFDESLGYTPYWYVKQTPTFAVEYYHYAC